MKRTIGIITTSGAVLLGVAACGGSSSPAPAANSTTGPVASAAPSSTANAAGGTGRGAGNRQALAGIANELPQIKQCLTAAGISTATLPTAIPTGRPSGFARPSGAARPSFNPSDRPTNRPSGGFGGFRGGAGGGIFSIFSNTADVAALKACGIAVPTFTGRRPGGALPTATPATT